MARRDHRRALLETLGREGPVASRALLERLGIGQATLSRLIAQERASILVTGRARATRYALRRAIPFAGDRVPLFEVLEDGTSRRLATLHAIGARGFYVEPASADIAETFHDDLPYFLHDLRPSGFLGRAIPRRHPEHGWPRDVRAWSGDHAMEYLVRYGWDSIGALVVGEDGLRAWLEHAPEVIALEARIARYPELAAQVLERGPIGSSAGGEQPKLLATIAPDTPVLVKFSPPVAEALGRRWSDLLVAEHLALEVLREHGHRAAPSRIVQGGGRTFLEVERFDRAGVHGRRGVISLGALSYELGSGSTEWTPAARDLAEARVIDDAIAAEVDRLAAFGELIANTDRHPANLSFMTRGTKVAGLAPAYDMLPMLYAPVEGNIVPRSFALSAPTAGHAAALRAMLPAARELWTRSAAHALTSEPFRAIARENLDVLDRYARVLDRLP